MGANRYILITNIKDFQKKQRAVLSRTHSWATGQERHGQRLRCWAGGDRTREFDCRVGEIWTPRWERAALLGRRDMDDGYAAGWERAELLGGRELDC